MGEQRNDERRVPHGLKSRLRQSNTSSLIVLVFQFIAVFGTAHPREFLFLTFCNRFIHASGVSSAEHAV